MKKKIIIALLLLGSGLFLYQGFSLLFHGEKKVEMIEDNASF
jgi:hypothetical protein